MVFCHGLQEISLGEGGGGGAEDAKFKKLNCKGEKNEKHHRVHPHKLRILAG